MPNPELRRLLAVGALTAALLMAGAGAGIAAADPDDAGSVSDTDPGGSAPSPTEPLPTTGIPPTPPSIVDLPNTIATQLHDMFGKPLSIFGDGRVPGTLTVPGVTTADQGAKTGRKRTRPEVEKEAPTTVDVTSAGPVASVQRASSAINVSLPFSPPISVPIPPPPVPGYENMQLTLDLTDPWKAYASVGQTLGTVNSLLSDAYAPHPPVKPPAPEPIPTFRVLDEGPTIADADASGTASPLAVGSSDLRVLQLLAVVPRTPFVAPRAITGTVRQEVERPGAAATGVRSPQVPAPLTQPGSIPAEPLPPSGARTAEGNPAVREGFPRYPRSARTDHVAMVALPGLVGLIAITASGGMIGYRQANSGRYLRSDATRFLR